eukprot:TRINITY_DN1340_c0_g2_i1.p1 TRINITY_DN1340_c0_g2~~TRINITY_DN1340_c0_g2_i1.p1  ORF type:complete len:633 (+),score=86.68 TRINITY_DN1340_c0_g2_i1:220-2118(+)
MMVAVTGTIDWTVEHTNSYSFFFIIRLVTCFFFLQFYTLVVTVLLNISIWLLYSIALPTTGEQLSTSLFLLVSVSSVIGLIIFCCLGFTLASSLSYALLDLWSRRQNPVLVDHFNFLFRSYGENVDHTDIIHCIKKDRTENERIFVFCFKTIGIVIPVIAELVQLSRNEGLNFFTMGLIVGGIYGLIWLILRSLVLLKTMYLIGFGSGLKYMGIHTKMSGNAKVLWSLCILMFLFCLIVPVTVYCILNPERQYTVGVGMFFGIFFSFPGIIMGYFFEYYHHRKRRSVGKFIFQQVILWLIVVFFVLLFIGVIRTRENSPCTNNNQSELYDSSLDLDFEKVSPSYISGYNFQNNTRDQYGICGLTWHGLNIVDYGLMTNLAYFTKEKDGCSEQVAKSLHQWFPKEPWAVVGGQKKGDVLGFLHLYNPVRKLSVITVRGTVPTRATDVLQDFDLFKEISVLQFMSYFFPIAKYWSDDMTQNFVLWASFTEKLLSNREYSYYLPLLEYVERTINETSYPGPKIFTGHSLGGAIAKIVGVKLNTTAVVFEAPGLLYSSKKFDLDTLALQRLVVNVALSNDIVAAVDKQVGLVQNVPCPSSNPLTCHSLRTGLCILFQSCNPALGTNSGNITMCTSQ